MKNNHPQLEDTKINVKLLLSSLWTSVMFLYIYGDYFELYIPGKIAGLLNGQNLLNTPYKLLLATILLVLPALMIALSLVLKPALNRVLHMITAAFLTLITLLVGISSLSEWRLFYVMLSLLESIITMLILWKAWHWPKVDVYRA